LQDASGSSSRDPEGTIKNKLTAFSCNFSLLFVLLNKHARINRFCYWAFLSQASAYLGSKRLMGAFNGIMYGVLFSFLGFLFILSFKRLDDHKADI
jgi:hypothetical protein